MNLLVAALQQQQGQSLLYKGGPGSGRHPYSDKAKAALASHKSATKDKQLAAAAAERAVASIVGGKGTDDNQPVDVTVGKNVGVEVKAVIDNGNNKITMHPESLARKEAWAKDNKATLHTVVVDTKTGKMYHREGVGSFRLANMQQVSAQELKARVGGAKKIAKGGPGSGNFGHEGRPGEVGGSGEGGGLAGLAEGKSGAIGPISVTVHRAGEMRDASKRGTFFAGTKEDAAQYSSIHGGAAPKEYQVEAKSAYVTESHMSLHRELFSGKTFQDAVWQADKRSGFKDSIAATRTVEAKMARELVRRGHDALIYTKPPAPAKTELAVLSTKTARITEVK